MGSRAGQSIINRRRYDTASKHRLHVRCSYVGIIGSVIGSREAHHDLLLWRTWHYTSPPNCRFAVGTGDLESAFKTISVMNSVDTSYSPQVLLS
jgi:hypothetical protein